MTNFKEVLNSDYTAKFCGVPLSKYNKLFRYEVVISPNTGFRNPIKRYFKTFESAQRFEAKLNK